MSKARFAAAGLLVGLVALIVIACGGDFDPQSKVTTVRMFGVQVDKPYANPGDTVTMTTLTTDGRRDKPFPLKTFWIPIICINPTDDLYYACFLGAGDGGATLEAPFADAGTAAATAGGATLDSIPKDVDLSGFLPQGDTFSFQLPQNLVIPRVGSAPYGLAIVFNIACAGQVRYVGRSGNNPQQVPIQCTDPDGKPLTPNDYVIGINRVYSYADRTNTNPVVANVTLQGAIIDQAAGLTIDHCVASRRSDCKEWKINAGVTDASWETNPDEGANQHEQIWVAYYSDLGDFEDDARLLFDSTQGRVAAPDVKYRAPYAPGEGTVWMVVHDNRAGAAFVKLPLHVR